MEMFLLARATISIPAYPFDSVCRRSMMEFVFRRELNRVQIPPACVTTWNKCKPLDYRKAAVGRATRCWLVLNQPLLTRYSFSYTDVHLSEWFQKNFATTFSKWQRWRAELVFSINYFRNLLLYFFVNSLDTTTQFDEIMYFLQLNNYTDLYIILSTWKMKNPFRIRGTDWTKLI